MNSKNSKTSNPYGPLLNLGNKINLKRSDKYVSLSSISIYYTWKNIKKSYKNNKFKIITPAWNEKFELLDGSYSVSDIQSYLGYVLKKHQEKTNNSSMRIYVNKIENRITFVIKIEYYPELLALETIKLFGSTKSKITKDINDENVLHLEITEVIFVHCNIVNNDYQQDLRVLYAFVPNKSFGQLIYILPKMFIFSKTFNSEFSYIELWFTDQNSKLLQIEDKINITLVIN